MQLPRQMSASQIIIKGASPKRIVIRFSVQHELKKFTILKAFFAFYKLENFEDYYSHLYVSNESFKMHIILDFHCKAVPTVNLEIIKHKVFKAVKKANVLYVMLGIKTASVSKFISHFSSLDSTACDQARQYSHIIRWGTDRALV